MVFSLILIPAYLYLGTKWTIAIAVFLITCFLLVKRDNDYFANNRIKSPTIYFPIIGNALKLILQREHLLEFVQNAYSQYPNEKYVGIKNVTQSVIVLKDLEVIKQITIKDFDFFTNHLRQLDPSIDPLLGNSLIALKGQKWRDMRATLSPAFTSSKMKGMFEFVNEIGKQMTQYYSVEAGKNTSKGKKYIDVELKDAFSRYTNDVIATSAFGINVNSLTDKDNEFYDMGRKTTTFSTFRLFKFVLMFAMPRLMKFLGATGLNPEIGNFFRNLVNSSMKQREEKGIVRHDMIHLLMEAKKGSLKHDTAKKDYKDAGFATVEESDVGKQINKREWKDDEIVAQAVIFFFAGFETASTLLSFMSYELARNPDIQKRLQDEIDELAEKNNGTIGYEDLSNLKYMDMVVSETLRHWPPAIMTDRKCVKPYTLPPSNNKDKTGGKVNVGDGLWIPIYAIHHDPKYFKNPEKFDPERFSEENVQEINPLAYLPFGIGPRNCIGSRFALMEVKSVMFYLLRKFNIVVTDKTDIPLKLNNKTFNLIPQNGFWLGLEPREMKFKKM